MLWGLSLGGTERTWLLKLRSSSSKRDPPATVELKAAEQRLNSASQRYLGLVLLAGTGALGEMTSKKLDTSSEGPAEQWCVEGRKMHMDDVWKMGTTHEKCEIKLTDCYTDSGYTWDDAMFPFLPLLKLYSLFHAQTYERESAASSGQTRRSIFCLQGSAASLVFRKDSHILRGQVLPLMIFHTFMSS